MTSRTQLCDSYSFQNHRRTPYFSQSLNLDEIWFINTIISRLSVPRYAPAGWGGVRADWWGGYAKIRGYAPAPAKGGYT